MRLDSKKAIGCGIMTASFLMMTGFKPVTADVLTQEQKATPAMIAFANGGTWSDVLEEKNELSMKLEQMGLTKEDREFSKVMLAGNGDNKEAEDRNTVADLLGEAGHAGIAQIENVVAELPKKEMPVQQKVKGPWDGKAMAKVNESANVRAKASKDAQIVGNIFKGTRADVIEQGEEWSKIKSGNVTGYVNNEYLAFGEEAEALSKKDTKVIATVKANGLRIRKAANTEAEISGVADKGSKFQVKAEENGWVKISADGGDRYVSSEFVEVARQYKKAKTMDEIKKEAAEKKAREAKANAASSNTGSRTASKGGGSTNKAAVSASGDTTSLLAALIYCEAGGESYEAQVAVGAVVMNRVRSGSFPNSIHAVIYQSGQFGPAVTGKLGRVLARGSYSSSSVSAAKEALAGRDNVNGALYFGFGNRGVKIGSQCFY